MTSISSKPVLLDDTELLNVVADPRARLFQVLTRVTAFGPLIVVCAFFPAFQLLTNPTLNEDASLWGLRSLAVANAPTLGSAIVAGSNELGEPMLYQPPLAAWLNGIVVRTLGSNRPLTSSLVALVATGIAIWLMTRLAKRIGGANTALVSALLMCSHPQILELAITPSNGAIGNCLILASFFGFQRHLEGYAVRISTSLFLSGVVWGLAVLAIGPVAFVVPIVFALHSLNQKAGNGPEFKIKRSFQSQLLQSRTVFRSTLFLIGTGLLVSCWWGFVLLQPHGLSFVRSWLSGLPTEYAAHGNGEWHCNLSSLLQPTFRDWLVQQSLILGWLVVGLERSWHAWRRPTSELARRRYQLMLLWWGVAIVGRLLAGLGCTLMPLNTHVWDIALLCPTILLSAVGIGTFIERDVSRRGEFFLFVLLVSLTAARLTMSWLFGLSCGAIAATILVCGPFLMPTMGRKFFGWSEEGWRQLMQLAVYGSLTACLSLGLSQRSSRTNEEARLADLRERLKTFPEVRRISWIASRDQIPVTLRYLLRSRWPKAELVMSEGWDEGLTQAMKDETDSPQSKFLILEWTRRDIRFSADTGQAWQISNLGDPIRFQDRRLSMALIEPRT